MSGIAQLTGTIKYYDWGGTEFIASLLKINNSEKKPLAEYWLGVHPQADCAIELPDSPKILLRDYIAENPLDSLGKLVKEKFGNIPYLLKALDVKDMLSIQVHPSRVEAEKDFAAENARGIALASPMRNYKDKNHKPELMVAMGDFWLLHGFKPEAALKKVLSEVPELQFLSFVFEAKGYSELYKTVMELSQEEVNERLQPLLDRIIPFYKEGKLNRSQEDFWAAKAHMTFSKPGITDRGLFSIYLFNVLHLKRGEAVFQDAGVPHAYMEGQNVEIMASSDNVLRGGLTTKHIDVTELLKHTKCEPTHPTILKGESIHGLLVYRTPAPDFELSRLELDKGQVEFRTTSAEILLLMEGEAVVSSGQQSLLLKKGQLSAILFNGAEVTVTGSGETLLFRARVPQ